MAVRNLEQSVSFYRKAFSFLGFSEGTYFADPIDKKPTVVYGNGKVYLELVEEPELVPKSDISTVAGPRIEFLAESKEEVDEFHKHLLAIKANVISSPQYLLQELLGDVETDPWYCVYFSDPNGIKFGLIYTLS